MKKLLCILSCISVLSVTAVWSQTVSQLTLYTYSQQQQNNLHCGTPATFYFYPAASASGLTTGDSVMLTISYGDGYIDTLYDVVSNLGGDTLLVANTQHIYTMPGHYTVNATAQVLPSGPPVSIPSPVTLVVSDSCGLVQGKIYHDANNNCVYDNGETVLSSVPVRFDDGSVVITDYSNSYGNYNGIVSAGPTYTIDIDPNFLVNNGLTVGCPNSGFHTVSTLPASNLDFGLGCNNFVPDLAVNAWGVALPLNNAAYTSTTVQNLGCAPQNTTLTITFPSSIMVSGFSQTPDAINGNTFTWNLSNFQNTIFMQNIYAVSYYIQGIPSLNINDTVCYTATIASVNGETDLLNNTVTLCLPVVNSYDPNDKQVSPAGDFTPGEEFAYVVRFQNTGNAPAINVSIMDTIHPDLDLSTLQIMGASHHMELYNDGNILKFDFPNIMLPDSVSDEPNSHGYVQYRIRSNASLQPGDQITNTAYIYFDFNPPIITNTTLNQVPFNVSVINHSGKPAYSVYPNPAYDRVIISGIEGVVENARLVDATGRLVRIVPQITNGFELPVISLESGIYYLQMGNSGQTLKIIRN